MINVIRNVGKKNENSNWCYSVLHNVRVTGNPTLQPPNRKSEIGPKFREGLGQSYPAKM